MKRQRSSVVEAIALYKPCLACEEVLSFVMLNNAASYTANTLLREAPISKLTVPRYGASLDLWLCEGTQSRLVARSAPKGR